ncbi:LysM peptidoglycan-binding domain-containing protein [Priestia aryabhattai]|uniref:LysM peptidoglycan-binding domain-containing protein n=1 Tax=Priestia aryabhattai TaxID=412384 RepID=UPI003B675A6F
MENKPFESYEEMKRFKKEMREKAEKYYNEMTDEEFIEEMKSLGFEVEKGEGKLIIEDDNSSNIKEEKPAAPATVSTYKVQSGDTLWRIATRFNMSVEELKRLNALSSNLIYVNQTLKVNGSTSASTSTTSKPAASATVSTYKVQSGDTLLRIATRFNMSVEELKRLNALSSNFIYVNQTLKVNGSTSASTSTTSKPAETPSVKKYFKMRNN